MRLWKKKNFQFSVNKATLDGRFLVTNVVINKFHVALIKIYFLFDKHNNI